MPIYAYRCEACGFTRDVLQKMSDAPLTECTSCGKPAFKKQLTAAGFQLKGSGWYVTDFKGGNSAAPASTDSKADGATKSDTAAAPAAQAAGATPAAAPAASSTPAAPAAT